MFLNTKFDSCKRIQEMNKTGSSETMDEVKRQLKLAGPLCLASFLNYSLEIISVMFIGHLGELSLSVASMATSFAAVTGYHFLVMKVDHFSSNRFYLSLFFVYAFGV